MSRLIDITGKRFNHLVVVKRVEGVDIKSPTWECLCDCGNTTMVRGSNLKSGAVKSCGCLREMKNKSRTTHGMSNTRLYREWASIKRRCYTVSDKSYQDYGARGIRMCEEWKSSFESFMEWALNNGYDDSLTIERVNVDEGYSPDNCTWIPWEQQQGNRRNCYAFEYNGEIKNLAEWCRELNLPYSLIHNRITKLGWSFEKAIKEPVDIKKRNKKNGRIRI